MYFILCANSRKIPILDGFGCYLLGVNQIAKLTFGSGGLDFLIIPWCPWVALMDFLLVCLVDCWVWCCFRILQVLIIQPVWNPPPPSLASFVCEMLRMRTVWDLVPFFVVKKRFALWETGIVVRYSEVVFGPMVPPFEEVDVWKTIEWLEILIF